MRPRTDLVFVAFWMAYGVVPICHGQGAASFVFPTANYQLSMTEQPVYLLWDQSNSAYEIQGVPELHTGEDIRATTNCSAQAPSGVCHMPVWATAPGTVMYSGTGAHPCDEGGWGYVIVIEHTLPDSSKVSSVYGHLDPSTVSVTVGQVVSAGTQLGLTGLFLGTQGAACWVEHFHFGIYLGAFGGKPGTLPSWVRGYAAPASFPAGFTQPSTFVLAHSGPTSGDITVAAALDGNNWISPLGPPTGTVNYTLLGPANLNTTQTTLQTFSSLPVGQYQLTYNSGTPLNSFLSGIAPCALTPRGPGSCTYSTSSASPNATFILQFTSNPPTAGFTMSSGTNSANENGLLYIQPPAGQPPTVTFNASRSVAYNPDSIINWLWTANGSVIGTTNSFSAFCPVGTYTINLVVTDSHNVLSTAAGACQAL